MRYQFLFPFPHNLVAPQRSFYLAVINFWPKYQPGLDINSFTDFLQLCDKFLDFVLRYEMVFNWNLFSLGFGFFFAVLTSFASLCCGHRFFREICLHKSSISLCGAAFLTIICRQKASQMKWNICPLSKPWGVWLFVYGMIHFKSLY